MKKFSSLLIVAVLATVLIVSESSAQRSLLKQFEAEFVALSEEISPSVVEISVTPRSSLPRSGRMDDMFKFFGLPNPDGDEGEPDRAPRPPSRRPSSTGTGFFIDEDGYIVTNNHVVDDAAEITVQLPNGDEVVAEVVGIDPDSDIAVIKIDPDGIDIVPVALGSSANLKVGQFAIAIGSARGQTGSVSYGHISGLGREGLQLPGDKLRFQEFIQTDAAINLGNSGGPLCNIDGEVIGVNVAIVYDANSIGFAIPIDRVKRVVPQLIADGAVTRGWLGVSITNVEQAAVEIENVELEDFMDANGLVDSEGTYVSSVAMDGPAEVAGIQGEDIIVRVNDHKVANTTDLINFVSELEPGSQGTIDVWRDGKMLTLDIAIGKFPGRSAARFGKDYLGMHVTEMRELSAEVLEQFELEEQPSDFYVVEVVPGSPAEEAGIRTEDIVLEVAHQEVESLEHFKALIGEHARPGKTLLLRVMRLQTGDESRKVYVKVPDEYEAN